MISEVRSPDIGIIARSIAWGQTERGVIVLAVVVGLALRLLAQPLHSYIGDDSDDYAAFARGLMVLFSGDSWRDTPAAIGGYGYSPGYPFITALFSYVTGNIWVAARGISLVGGLAVIYATYVFGRELFGTRVGLIAGWVIAVSSVMVGQSARTATEMMFVLLVLIAMIALLRALRGSNNDVGSIKTRSMWIAGFALASAALTRPEGFVIGGVLVVIVLWQSKRFSNIVPLVFPGVLMMIVWTLSGFLRYFIDHYRGVNSAVDAGLSASEFLTQLASQSFHVGTGNLTALGLVVLALAAVGVIAAWMPPGRRTEVVLLLSIPISVGLFLTVTPGLGDMNRYIAVMVPVWAVFAGYGVIYSIDQLGVDVSRSGAARWVLIAAMALVVVSVFDARAIGERSLTWDAVASAQSTSLEWIADNSESDDLVILDLAGISQVDFADDAVGYSFESSTSSELHDLPEGYDFVVVQQPSDERYELSGNYTATADISAFQGHAEFLVYTIYAPLQNSSKNPPLQIRASQVETVWDWFWGVR